MIEREKLIKGIQECNLNGGLIGNCPYKGILLLLKEQEKKKFFVDSDGKITPLPDVVRCKECKFRQSRVSRIIDGKECNLCEMVKGYKPADWYCADGKRK